MTPILSKDGTREIKSRYHKIFVNGKPIDAHRHIMECHLGRKLKTWEEVHHKDNDPHNNAIGNLEVLTKSEHFKRHLPEMSRKQWTPEAKAEYSAKFSGERSTSAKLTQAQADEIRERLKAGEKIRRLAAEFGVHPTNIYRIKSGQSYAPAPAQHPHSLN